MLTKSFRRRIGAFVWNHLLGLNDELPVNMQANIPQSNVPELNSDERIFFFTERTYPDINRDLNPNGTIPWEYPTPEELRKAEVAVATGQIYHLDNVSHLENGIRSRNNLLAQAPGLPYTQFLFSLTDQELAQMEQDTLVYTAVQSIRSQTSGLPRAPCMDVGGGSIITLTTPDFDRWDRRFQDFKQAMGAPPPTPYA